MIFLMMLLRHAADADISLATLAIIFAMPPYVSIFLLRRCCYAARLFDGYAADFLSPALRRYALRRRRCRAHARQRDDAVYMPAIRFAAAPRRQLPAATAPLIRC